MDSLGDFTSMPNPAGRPGWTTTSENGWLLGVGFFHLRVKQSDGSSFALGWGVPVGAHINFSATLASTRVRIAHNGQTRSVRLSKCPDWVRGDQLPMRVSQDGGVLYRHYWAQYDIDASPGQARQALEPGTYTLEVESTIVDSAGPSTRIRVGPVSFAVRDDRSDRDPYAEALSSARHALELAMPAADNKFTVLDDIDEFSTGEMVTTAFLGAEHYRVQLQMKSDGTFGGIIRDNFCLPYAEDPRSGPQDCTLISADKLPLVQPRCTLATHGAPLPREQCGSGTHIACQ